MSDRLEERKENVRPEQPEPEAEPQPEPQPDPEPDIPQLRTAEAEAPEAEAPEHAPGRFEVPSGYGVMTGSSDGEGLSVGVVVAKFNGEITRRLLSNALEELEATGVSRQSVTIVPVPGAFELPLAAIALAKTRKYACIVALGCVVRGETPHFDYVAGEAASGLQLAAIETGVPVAFGVLTTDTIEQAEARIDRVGDVVRGAVEMANLFQQLRAAAK